MAGRTRTAKVRIEVDGAGKAAAEAKKTENAFTRLANRVKGVGVAAWAAYAAAVAVAARTLRAVFGAITDAEDATVRLDAAIKAAGQTTATSASEFDAWATTLQRTTTLSSEQAKEAAALALQFGATNEGARELAAVAADFAAGAGINFEEAVRRMGRAMQGSTDDVAKFAPGIRDLSKAQLAAGEATRLLGEAMAGQAAAAADTLSGAVSQLGNEINTLIVRLLGGADGVGGLTEKIRGLTETIGTSAVFKALSFELKVLGEILGAIVTVVTTLTGALGKLIALGVRPFQTSLEDVNAEGARFKEQADRMGISVGTLQIRVEAARQANKDAGEMAAFMADGIENAGAAAVAAAGDNEKLAASSKGVGTAAGLMADGIENAGAAAVAAAGDNEKLTASIKGVDTAYSAAVDSFAIFGSTTSITLTSELLNMIQALEDAKTILGENSDEFVALRERAEPQIERLRERIQSLRDGLGDLNEETEKAGKTNDLYSETLNRTADSADRAAAATRRLSTEQQLQREKLAELDRIQSERNAGDSLFGPDGPERTTGFNVGPGIFAGPAQTVGSSYRTWRP